MGPMSDLDPTPHGYVVDPEALSRVATLVRAGTRLANRAAGTDLRSPWLDVVADCVTAAGYLTDVPDAPGHPLDVAAPSASPRAGTTALEVLTEAAQTLDGAHGRRDHRVVLVRAALTDAIATARRLQS